MTVLAGNIVRATVNLITASSSIAQNVYFYEAGAGVNDTDLNVITAIRSKLGFAYAEIAGKTSNEWSLGDVDVSVSTDSGATFFDIGSLAMTNGQPAALQDAMPSGIAAVVRFGGLGTGREGRKFLGGLGVDFVDDDDLDAALVTDLISYALVANDNVVVAGGSLLYGWLRRSPLSFILHDGSITVNTIAGYQRRRKPGVGI